MDQTTPQDYKDKLNKPFHFLALQQSLRTQNQGMQNYKYLIINHLQNQYFLNDEVRKEIFEIW